MDEEEAGLAGLRAIAVRLGGGGAKNCVAQKGSEQLCAPHHY